MTPKQIIKALMNMGDSHRQIARATGISQSTISRLADTTHETAYSKTVERLEFYYSERTKK